MKRLILMVILAASLGGCARYVHRRPVDGGEEVAKVTLWFQRAEAGKVASRVRDGGYERDVGFDGVQLEVNQTFVEALRVLAERVEGLE